MASFDRPDIDKVLHAARLCSLDTGSGFIGTQHTLLAMRITDCRAQQFLLSIPEESLRKWYQVLMTPAQRAAPLENVPLTINLERVIRHSTLISERQHKEQVDSVDLLLSLLSYDNDVTYELRKYGILHEDVANGAAKVPLEIKRRTFSNWRLRLSRGKLAFLFKRLAKDIQDHAIALWTYQQYDDCIAICQQALQHYPFDEQFAVLLANCYYMNQQYAVAEPLFTDLYQRYPDNMNLGIMLAAVLDKLNRYAEVNTLYAALLVSAPNNAMILNNAGFSLMRQEQYATAIPYLEKAMQIDPSMPYPYDNLGFAKHKLGDKEEGLRLIDHSLTIDKGNSYAYLFKGKIFLEAGEYAKAKEQFDLALRYGFTKQYGNEVIELMRLLPDNQ